MSSLDLGTILAGWDYEANQIIASETELGTLFERVIDQIFSLVPAHNGMILILDERTGTVVMGENIKLGKIALSHGNLSIKVSGEAAAGDQGSLLAIEHGTSLGEVVRALNSIGVTPRDMVAIFQSIKASGALQAELEII